MIGSAVEAKTIREGHEDGIMPLGWCRLSEGCFRAVYLSPSGVVYKVNFNDSEGANEREYNNIISLQSCKLPEGVRLPLATYYEDSRVIAMEYFEKTVADVRDKPRYRALHSKMREEIPVRDLHIQNVMIDEENDMLVPIDLGEYGSSTYEDEW